MVRKSLFILTELTFYYWSLKKQSIFLLSLYTATCLGTPTSLLISVQSIFQWEATRIWWLWHRHEHLTKFSEFIFEEILPFDFSNFMCIISLYIIILKFVQVPWPDVYMSNLEECIYHVLTNFTLLCKNVRLLKKTWIGIKLDQKSLHGFSKRCYKRFIIRS